MRLVRLRSTPSLLAVALVLSLAAAACGGDDGGDESTQSDTGAADVGDALEGANSDSATAGEDPFAGCAEGGSVDPADLSVGRPVARCEPGYPKPVPLADRQVITLSSQIKAEFVAPVLLAEAFGEFEKENLDFEYVTLPFGDALPQLGAGEIDLSVGGADAAFYNSANSGFDVKWVSGNFYPPDAGDLTVPQTGLWARAEVFSDPSEPDPAELKGTTMGSAVGLTSVIAYPIAEAFRAAGVSLGADVAVQSISGPDMQLALDNDGIQSGWFLDPRWEPLAEHPDKYVLVATQPPGEPLGGLFAGPGCLIEKREACVAFHRALIRTINTYLTGDYHAEPDVMTALGEATGLDPDVLSSTPSLLFDWEIRKGTTTRVQEAFIGFGENGEPVFEHDTPIPEDQLVDRSIYLEAVGKG